MQSSLAKVRFKTTVDYPAILQAAWKDHQMPKVSTAPIVISLFAGGGGSSLGYSMAGFKELLAVEWDENAVATFRLNFPDVPVYHGDIARLSVEECLQITKLQPGELDLLDGSPPCQGFSTAGKRILEDSRNQLFREYVRLLQGLKPKVMVMENVSGMVKGRMKLVFAEIMQALKESGYQVSARLINTMYFNVPQSRERMIFVGIRNDLGLEPSHPKAQKRPFTITEAWKTISNDNWDLAFANKFAGYRVAEFWSELQPGKNHHKRFNLVKVHPDRPGPTITKGVQGFWGAAWLCHHLEKRYLTISECKRIASFPDDFQLIGDFPERARCLGNSVPPLFMRAIAEHIRTTILKK